MRTNRLGGVVLLVSSLSGCAYEQSFKTVTFEGVARDDAFTVCENVIVSHYQGTRIRANREEGKIETDPVEFMAGSGTLREQVYLDLTEDESGRVTVAVFAPMSEMVIDLDGDPPVRWHVKGSDVTQEELMLDEILAGVLRQSPEARLVESGITQSGRWSSAADE